MKKRLIYYSGFVFLIAYFIIGFVNLSFAKTGYVSDVLFLTVRNGPGNNFKVLKTLKSNDPVELFEKKDGYYRVKTTDGTEGWVQQQYITYKIPQVIAVAGLNNKIANLEEKNKKLSNANVAMTEKIKIMEQEFKMKTDKLNSSLKMEKQAKQKIKIALDEANNKYESFVKQAGDAVQLINENKKLKQDNLSLSLQIKSLTAENGHFFKSEMIKWFLAGAGVLILGWLIGISIRGRKRSSGRLIG